MAQEYCWMKTYAPSCADLHYPQQEVQMLVIGLVAVTAASGKAQGVRHVEKA